MHELTIVANIFDIVKEELGKRELVELRKIHLKIGEFSGVVPDTLKFAFDVAKVGTIFDKAVLDLDIIPFLARCKDCRKEFSMEEDFLFMCPFCSSQNVDVVSGKELFVDSIEIEE